MSSFGWRTGRQHGVLCACGGEWPRGVCITNLDRLTLVPRRSRQKHVGLYSTWTLVLSCRQARGLLTSTYCMSQAHGRAAGHRRPKHETQSSTLPPGRARGIQKDAVSNTLSTTTRGDGPTGHGQRRHGVLLPTLGGDTGNRRHPFRPFPVRPGWVRPPGYNPQLTHWRRP